LVKGSSWPRRDRIHDRIEQRILAERITPTAAENPAQCRANDRAEHGPPHYRRGQDELHRHGLFPLASNTRHVSLGRSTALHEPRFPLTRCALPYLGARPARFNGLAPLASPNGCRSLATETTCALEHRLCGRSLLRKASESARRDNETHGTTTVDRN
jgi:hypothetical protein